MKKLPIKYYILMILTPLSLVIDQWTKHIVHSRFAWGETVPVISGLFSFTYVRNSGAAFGIMHNAPSYFREPFFIFVPVIALFIIGFLFYRLPKEDRVTATALSLILGGAVGNLIDRLRFGYVIDFLDFYIGEHHWPAFNIADSCIVVGVCLLFLMSLKSPKTEA